MNTYYIKKILFPNFGIVILSLIFLSGKEQVENPEITHGPTLGEITENSVKVWVRTSEPADFFVTAKQVDGIHEVQQSGSTRIEDDNTGWVILKGLESDTEYEYQVRTNPDEDFTLDGTFRTIPSSEVVRNDQHNPEGLFNFSFEFGACNFQNPEARQNPLMPAYQAMNHTIQDEIDFHLMLGDFIYEYNAGRDTPVSAWQSSQGITEKERPEILDIMPDLVGIWQNYKLYYTRAPNLQEWHRNVPSYFMFDDHEILNDINGAGTPGIRDEVTLFRDIGIQAWDDYLGWANPVDSNHQSKIQNGKADVDIETSTLYDPNAKFSQLDRDKVSNLHIHWNDGHPAAGVYEIEEIIDQHQIKLKPTPSQNAEDLSYSIGTHHFYSFKVGNAEFFVLDTRSMRDRYEKRRPGKPDISMLGETQKKWLVKSMKQSDADFLFVASSVSFVIPHVADDLPEKDESWTVYLNEREELIEFWDDLQQPVMLLTGDLHNAMSIQIEDNIFEFMSGAHNSGNHYLNEEGNRPTNGPFTYNGRTVNLRWSTFWHPDVPRTKKRKTIYTVVKMNNVFNNPTDKQDPRWVAYSIPQVVIQFYDGATGDLLYAETVTATK